MVRYRPGIGSTESARKLRRNPTDAEKAMWRILPENYPDEHFRRRAPIRTYVVDFVSHRARLAIEVDGGQHEPERDAARSALIEAEGYRLIRFWNHDVLGNPDGVASAIAQALRRHPHPTLPHQGGGPA